MEDENPFTKSQTIDPEVRAYVYSLVNALGGTSGDIDGRYVLGDDALAVLRDLKRWLRLYDEKTNRLDVARCLAEAKLVVGDLLPILASWSEDGKSDKLRSRTALACLELLVPLTWPLEQKEMTVNHHRHTPYLQQAQVLYKAGILNCDNAYMLRQAIRVSLPSIAMLRDERTARDEGIIKLVLYFLRNVTMIRQIPNLPSQGLENEISRSATIEAFREQDVFALLLTICSNTGEDFNLQDVIILEILFNLVKGVSVEKLWMTEAQRKGREVSDLKATLNEEKSLYQEYRKNGPSRHGRFGTMIWLKREGEKNSAVSGQDNIRDNRNALLNIDKSKKWSRPLQKRKDIDHTINDFDRETHLTTSAAEKLRNFAEEFLDSGFNPLITHLRKAIEREAERMLDVNYRQFFYVVAWFLQAERVRREKHKKELKPANLVTEFGAESFSLVAAVLNQETFVTISRYMQSSLDNKEWQDLNACMRCFTQILLTVQEMAQSPLEEDQEIADNIQNRIFYEESTHDKIASIVKGYKDQGFGYLDACTELSHVFLRMLERYSKENVDLQVRSRRRAKKKRKEEKKGNREQGEEADEDVDSENEDMVDVTQVSRERKFDFKRFAIKFTSQSSVDTFVAFTTFFRELSIPQLKRAHRFFHRVAFKQELAVLLYRVDIVALFYKMTQGPEGLSRQHPMYAEYCELSKQVFRKMFKKLEQRPELLVELLFSKINKTIYYLEYGHDKIASSSTRAPAELEVKSVAGNSISGQIGLVVTILIKDGKSSLISWLKDVLDKAYDERHGWEAEAEARSVMAQTKDGTNGEFPTENVPAVKQSYMIVRPANAEIQTATFKNARLRLLMKLVHFEILEREDTPDATWIIPADITSDQLRDHKKAIEQYEISPWQSKDSDIEPEDMLRRVRHINQDATFDAGEEVRRDAFIDDSEGDDDPDLNEEFLFPDNIRSKSENSKSNPMDELKAKRRLKRKRDRPEDSGDDDTELDNELAAKRRRLREEAALDRRRKIKSELYIRDSDDETDDERDREFFQQEEETRRRQGERVRGLMAQARGEAAAEKTRKSRKKQKKIADENNAIISDTAAHDLDGDHETAHSSQTMRRSDSDVDMSEQEVEKETPLSSPHISDEEDETVPVLKNLSQPRIMSKSVAMRKGAITADIDLDDGSEEEDNVPASLPLPTRRSRAGFIIDSDDDE